MLLGDTNPDQPSLISAWLIINDTVQYRTFPFELLRWGEAGPHYLNDYGGGCTHWSVVAHPSEAFDRQLKDNVVWAVNRLPFSEEHCTNEVEEIREVINSNGYTRLPATLNKFRTLRSLYPKPENEDTGGR
jgi:hypothetical protein